MAHVHFVGVSGSLRKESLNTALLHSALLLLPDDVSMEIASIDSLPLYNADVDFPAMKKRPEAVITFRNVLAKADALVIASPEYNYSIPGGLKNAIDWASRGDDSPLMNKPVALMGATPGMWGTIKMQVAFHTIFQYLNMKPVNRPELLISQANAKFKNGTLTDEPTIDLVKAQLAVLKTLALKANLAG